MAYRLFTLYALYQLDRDPGHIRSVRPLMDDFVKQASLARDRIGHEMAPSTHFKINCTIVGQTRYTCRGLRDGQPITPLYEAPPLINGRDAHDVMREAIRRSWAPITEPLQRQADDFLKSANTSIKYAIQAYDQMCRRVGDTYPIPPGTSPLLNIGPPTIPPFWSCLVLSSFVDEAFARLILGTGIADRKREQYAADVG